MTKKEIRSINSRIWYRASLILSPSGTMELIASSGEGRIVPKECSLRKKRKRRPTEGSHGRKKSQEGSHSSLSRFFDLLPVFQSGFFKPLAE